ncbi:MAG: fasciclin domain-containing protein [Tunicatimonas sp.]
MKKLSLNFLLMLGLMSTLFFACGDDDTPDGPTLPTITSLSPASGEVGTTITVNGTNLASATISFGTVGATVQSPTATSVQAVVPQLAPGEYDVIATVSGNAATSPTKFTVTAPATATETIAAIAQGNNDLSVLVAALTKAELVATLDGTTEYTVFAPTNQAFTDAGIVPANVSKEDLAAVLQDHVVAGIKRAADLKNGDRLTALSGKILPVTVNGTTVTVGGATVTTPNVEAVNGVVHIVNKVVTPEIPVVTVTGSAEGVGNVRWTADNIYLLEGFVYVNDGQTLTIDPGTLIKGRPGQAGDASALVVAQGGRILAEGTAEAPIIFTGETDDLNGSVPDTEKSLWGGVIILGRASTNNLDVNGIKNIEGLPTEDTRGTYGGTADDEDSGVLSYVSIRHGGSIIGDDNEINGLSLGGVGSGTTISNIEVWSNADDGIEFFGGTVNATNIVVAYCGDDGLDADEGYRGNVQNAIVWQTSATLRSKDPSAMELDGGVGANEEAEPYSTPNFANLTLFYDEGDNDLTNAINIRDNSGASIYNSIAINHDAAFAIERTDLAQNSYTRFTEGDLVVSGNIFYNINEVVDAANFADLFELSNLNDPVIEGEVETAIAAANTVTNPTFGAGATKFTPTAAAVTADLATVPEGLTTVTYKGAVDPTAATPYFANWTKTWAVINK